MHHEIEQAGLGHEHRPDVGTHAEPARWHVVNILDADAVPIPLWFDTLEQARTYVARTPGTLRIVNLFGSHSPPLAAYLARVSETGVSLTRHTRGSSRDPGCWDRGSGDEQPDEHDEEGLSAPAGVVHDLEEGEV